MTPIIVGVLCVDVAVKLQQHYGDGVRSYIPASYVKYLAAQGAHVIPIWIGRDRNYYEQIMTKLNGVLLPGGAVFIDAKQTTDATPNACVQSAAHIIEIAIGLNATGVRHFPIWGTCLGFQLLVLLHAAICKSTDQPKDVQDFRTKCTEMRCKRSWQITAGYRQSKLLQDLSEVQIDRFTTRPVAYHYHQYCITPERFKEFGCNSHWRILATQRDENELVFITMVEHCEYPFYGVQFHPERAAYEHSDGDSDNGAVNDAIEAASFLARHFIAECRRTSNAMSSAELQRYSIDNFEVTHTAQQVQGRWQECYLFDAYVDYPK